VRLVDNLHVRELAPLTPPWVAHNHLPLTEAANATVYEAREVIKNVLWRRDSRFLAVVGPCSIHDPEAALEYAGRLREAHLRYRDKLFIIMRTYFEKPRTTVGWRGLINDPDLDGSFNMDKGLRLARELLLKINDMGLPIAVEMLDPISPQYISDLVGLGTIGARTTESQTHRAMASGLSMPIGYKNGTDGGVQVAINAFLSARSPHSFLGITPEGASCVVKTTGNPDGLVILRGSRGGPNYDAAHVREAEEQMRAVSLPPALMVDCSHANSGGDYTRQEGIWNEVLHNHLANNDSVVGMMVESNLHEGKQPIASDRSQMRYGVSVTDGCVSWETTERMLASAYELLSARR
jgi:3-deoxy-7-phosphoheptulonate synthase